jgi:hypothetical protein
VWAARQWWRKPTIGDSGPAPLRGFPLGCNIPVCRSLSAWHSRAAKARQCLVLFLACWFLGAVATYAAEWSAEKKNAVTEYMQQYRRDWTLQDTEALSRGNVPYAEATVFVEGRPVNLRLKADDGRQIPVEVFGGSILVDGKDLSGNLGSKTTYGSNSPIVEDVRNSQITTGAGSPITQTKSSYTISISLSLALSLSVVLNLYLWRRMRKGKLSARREGVSKT